MYTFGVVISAITLAPIAVIAAFAICLVFLFNLIARELMLAAWDLAERAVSEIEMLVKDLVSEKKTSVVSVKEGRN